MAQCVGSADYNGVLEENARRQLGGVDNQQLEHTQAIRNETTNSIANPRCLNGSF